ncbi:AmmeMemoRadiSam system protein A [Thauera sinica]|uniref:AmmeMemoRadiSam system protein A n=1 Tax=Thauera sinica TaxID=2665146 RepID=A0ABW1AWH4_9RHOO|nr:AmmeMemoRadiSam system protein A [Thauera sp. K11]ATE60246.1 AMMECR1 domain-containing protein [Thauera sp. K11]
MNRDSTDLGATLLTLARQAIAHHLGLGPAPLISDDPRLHARGATFVTLTLDGELRGCIGSLRRQRPLGEDVVANAVAAASEDPRFAPLPAGEFDDVHVGVSLLSEPEFIDFTDEADLLRQLRPHHDGLILFSGCGSATFLPQVWEQLPEPRNFLAALKRKAGMPAERPVDGLMAARYAVEKWEEAVREA